MLKTVLVLPDGTELTSGTGTVTAVQNVTLTECVNDSEELTPGSVCANMLEAELITPGGGFSLAAGEEITVYKEDGEGLRVCVGLFTLEEPVRASANSYSLTAYDRVSRLDKDLTAWLAALDGWPYSLYDFAGMVCDACGLVLSNTEFPNGGYMVRKFSADGITGRQLMQWAGQIAGRFCRATADGLIEFAWYAPYEDITIGPTSVSAAQVSYDAQTGALTVTSDHITVAEEAGAVSVESEYVSTYDDENGGVGLVIESSPSRLFYFMNSLTYADYQVAPIEKVQLRQNDEDVGTVYPDTAQALNTYIITGNYLLSAATGEELTPVAQVLYEGLKDAAYTPCKVMVPAELAIRAGHIIQITDLNGKTVTAYVMKKTQSGQTDTLECTGSARRDSSAAVNNQSFKALSGKVLNLRTDVDGLKAESKDTTGKVAILTLDMDTINAQVSRQQTDMEGVKQHLTSLQQTAESISLSVQSLQQEGTSQVKTSTGYTFDADGLRITKDGEQMENLLDNTGMYVKRSGQIILQANDAGVVAADVTVHNYLIVGSHARFEDYTDGTDSRRTACFFI